MAKYLVNEKLIVTKMNSDQNNKISIDSGFCSKCKKDKCKHIKELSKISVIPDGKVLAIDVDSGFYFLDSLIFNPRGNTINITSCVSYHDDLSSLSFLSSLEFYSCDLMPNIVKEKCIEISTKKLLQEQNIKWRIENGSSIIINNNGTVKMNTSNRRKNGLQ